MKSSGFVVKYPHSYMYLTASHCFRPNGMVSSDELRHFLLMQPGDNGAATYLTFDAFFGKESERQKYEIEDIVGLRITKEHEEKCWGYVDHSNPPLNAMIDKLADGDQLVVAGWYFASDLTLIDEQTKTVKHWPSNIPLIYKSSGNMGMHAALVDADITKILGYGGEELSGISGSPVWKIEAERQLSWAGVVLQAASGIVRFVDARIINARWMHIDRIHRRT